jgi:hypothetical protein
MSDVTLGLLQELVLPHAKADLQAIFDRINLLSTEFGHYMDEGDNKKQDLGPPSVLDDDIIMCYDFTDDDVGYMVVTKHMDQADKEIEAFLFSIGYAFMDNMDGSGGGLYYGTSVYRVLNKELAAKYLKSKVIDSSIKSALSA